MRDGAELRADLCIVGAGAAGIALARELAGEGRRIALLESGGLEPSDATQALYRGASVGRPYFPLDSCRLRYFGGTTNHWAGHCRPLDPLDFQVRPWIPNSGWPIDRAQLDPWYRRAQELLELGPFDYDARAWLRRTGAATLPLDPRVFAPSLYQLSPPTRFGAQYRSAIGESRSIDAILDASAVELEASRDGRRVASVRAATLAGNAFRVAARRFVLATGGIENARLLLASRSPAHPDGLGNRHGVVGRYFLEHPHLIDAFLVPERPLEGTSFYQHLEEPGGRYWGTLALAPEVLRSEGLADVNVALLAHERVADAYLEAATSAGVTSLSALRRDLARGQLPDEFARHVWNVIRNLDDVALQTWGRIAPGRVEGQMYHVWFKTEQVPDPESRVLLDDERDALGSPRARLDWRLSDLDRHTLQRGHELFALAVGRAGVGRFFFPGADGDRVWIEEASGGSHHMGTTRMHADPRQGVVDADCRVHGVENLYVAGSSVFPTCGYANPTLTLVALALRLADHLDGELRRG